MGQFTAPQNTATIPSAAPKLAGMPSSPPIKHPNVAPIKKAGTISPPLKPQPMVRAVNTIFKAQAQGTAAPPMAAVITSVPAPL